MTTPVMTPAQIMPWLQLALYANQMIRDGMNGDLTQEQLDDRWRRLNVQWDEDDAMMVDAKAAGGYT